MCGLISCKTKTNKQTKAQANHSESEKFEGINCCSMVCALASWKPRVLSLPNYVSLYSRLWSGCEPVLFLFLRDV